MTTQTRILIVDDDCLARESLAGLLHSQGYDLAFASNGRQALELAINIRPDLILLDVMMPDLNGFTICRELRQTPELAEVAILLLSALDDSDSRLQGLEAGADDMIAKPFDRVELRARIRTIARLNRFRRLFDERERFQRELSQAYDATLEGWARALELRDKETEGHCQRVTALTTQLAQAMGIGGDELIHIRRGALLHDIGKLGVPDSILLKPGPLTDQEWAVMRLHPIYACQMLAPITYLRPALTIPRYHHERWDGNGYPEGLQGENIPLAARMFAVVDAWDAMRFDRPYRKAMHEADIIACLQNLAGIQFDPYVVEVFVQLQQASIIYEQSM
jgi:putative two-component system response regulator